jgi:glycosyltransferase involved in cell wall biosynthesis
MAAPIIVECLYSFRIGGSEKLGALLARSLSKRGYRVLALSFFNSTGPIRTELEEAGIECFGLDVDYRSPLRRATLPFELRRWFSEKRPDVVHLHHGVTAIRGVEPARSAGVRRIVVTEHADLQLRTEASYRGKVRRILPRSDAITVVNDELVDYFKRELAVPAARVRMVPNAVDDEYGTLRRDHGERQRLGLTDAFVFAFVGRLVREKDLGTLLEALSIARLNSSRDLRLIIVGDGVEGPTLKEKASNLSVEESVLWLGAQKSARRALALADAFAMSSVSEGVPMAMLEAMRAGLPCIATDVGGIAAVLADGCGAVVPPSDPQALAAALRSYAECPDHAARIGAAGAARVAERYSLGSVVDRYLETFGLPLHWDSRAA